MPEGKRKAQTEQILFWGLQGEHGPADTLISNFKSPELRNNKFLLFKGNPFVVVYYCSPGNESILKSFQPSSHQLHSHPPHSSFSAPLPMQCRVTHLDIRASTLDFLPSSGTGQSPHPQLGHSDTMSSLLGGGLYPLACQLSTAK